MQTRSTTRSSRSGFSLVELLIAVGLLSLVFLAATTVSSTGIGVFRSTTVNAGLDGGTLRAIDRVSVELARADSSSLVPPSPEQGTSQLAFQQVIGLVEGERVLAPAEQFVLEYEAGEVNDGIDNNGNGLVDESMVVLLRDAGGADEQRVVLCRGVRELLEGELPNGIDDNGNGLVDERGFSLQWVRGVLCVRLSREEIDATGKHVVRTLQTSIRIRNPS